MTTQEFLQKYPLNLSPAETGLLKDAVFRMEAAKDVHHGISHIYSLLGCFDEFMGSEDFLRLNPKPDLKVIFFAILCHDCWRAKKDPKGVLGLLWYTILENYAASRLFAKMASKYKVDAVFAGKIKYCIKVHGWKVFSSVKTTEAKILTALDDWDQFNEGRINVIANKFLLDRPLKRSYAAQGRLAVKLFLEPDSAAASYFAWIGNKIRQRKQIIIPRIQKELEEYDRLIALKEKGALAEFEESFSAFKKNVLNN